MSIRAALDIMISMQGRQMSITRDALTPITASIKAAPSNYFRNLQGDSEIVIEGREFVITRSSLESVSFPFPIVRGDVLEDPDLGVLTISESREMFDVGGKIIGYRVRTS